jgi:hypothetical protein
MLILAVPTAQPSSISAFIWRPPLTGSERPPTLATPESFMFIVKRATLRLDRIDPLRPISEKSIITSGSLKVALPDPVSLPLASIAMSRSIWNSPPSMSTVSLMEPVASQIGRSGPNEIV